MGEQMPMETVREFAEAIWSSDPSVQGPGAKAGELFSVPDTSAGSRELRRISTRKSRPRANAEDPYYVRNEFFELYWADSTNDTTWPDFLRWYARLVFRPLKEVPAAVFWIWVPLWVVNLLFVLGAEIAALWLIPTEIDRAFEAAANPENAVPAGWLVTLGTALRTDTSVYTFAILAGALVAAIGGKLVHTQYPQGALRKVAYWAFVLGAFVGVWCFIVLAGLFSKPLVVAAFNAHTVFWAGALVLISALVVLVQGFLVKFFGDVARYTIASPGNILPRQKVRDRGLDLIKRLSATGRYDRIILVAHSLGCIIAYDIINLLWSDYVATRERNDGLVPSADGMMNEVQAVINASMAEPFDLAAFRRAQRSFHLALQKADRERLNGIEPGKDDALVRWLISDLVTIACPLTHANFLLAKTATELDQRIKRRELSTCPPYLEEHRDGKHYLTYHAESVSASRFIHDAVFAGVRWTSIHDRPANRLWFLFGDFIAGPIREPFGKGIADIKVEPRWESDLLPERFFTHTIYWNLRQPDADPTPRSVLVIRNAVNILDEDAVEAALLAEVGQEPTQGRSQPAPE
ncbi:hypothetical protein C2U70_13280 [Bradyrhizobium guangdongense]|nr:hypothetical protein C2U70_13280 [Bradyrhizobium guangdongense]